MHFWKWIGIGYLALCAVILLVVFIWLVVEDIAMLREPWRKNNSKFGYNLLPNGPGSVWGVGWMILAALLPCVNLLVLAFFIWTARSNHRENRRMTRG